MPITVSHDLDPALLGALSYVAGREQYRQRQSEQRPTVEHENPLQLLAHEGQRDLARHREQLLQDRPAVPPRVAVSPPARTVARPSGPELARTAIREDRDIIKGRDRIRGNLIEQLLVGQRRQDASEFALINDEVARRDLAERAAFKYAADSAGTLETQARDVETALAKLRPRLQPEGKRIYGELAGKLRSIQKTRGFAPPAEYARLLGQWLEEYEQSGIQDHVIEQPTIEQYIAENAWDNGKGYTFVRQPTGRIQALETSDPKPADSDTAVQEEKWQNEREEHLLDIKAKRVDAYAAWMKARPNAANFKRIVPGAIGPDGKAGPAVQVFDEATFNRVMAYWQAMDPSRLGSVAEPGR